MDYYALLCSVSDYSDGTIDKNYGMGTFKWKVIHPTNFDEEIFQEITLTPTYYKNINNKSKKIETVNFNNYIYQLVIKVFHIQKIILMTYQQIYSKM